jgi:hypothetical protein
VVVLAFAAPSRAAPADSAADPGADLDPVYRAQLYEPGSNRSKLLFEYHIFESSDHQRRATRYLDPGGALVVREQLVMEGNRLRNYAVEHLSSGRAGRIERAGDQLRFSWSADGGSETATEHYSDDVVVGLMIVPFIQAHWVELSAGRALPVRLAIADRLQSFGFELVPEPDAADGVRTIRFAPASWMLRMLVDPMFFSLSRDGRTVLRIVGRTTPLRLVGGAWQPVDVEGLYTQLVH